ncbi:chromosome segregation protein SMC [Jatrophihabitans cynanchi]|uniref:Chromosome partition protein Smc n=1 Tax=Jatrophihabitans cynanchi TaxID=2944128 RepID=A0ABY7JZ15_9ACTN|nr:chromosome segregation protein SMC [Jatrophihabitans sp. SB3-54]WAX57806.1 chromosome segregation protein SMC [Jatrophihabitans sp. SB3-54]
MHLKSLTLRGFKSFASATTLRFEPGVTAVVGPNGSGKSNVVDAIAWVLGEQGAKALRGGKMQDVIFAGTAGRPPLGRAEVTLTIDNTDSALPIDYTEVSITRRMFREGTSEYEINGEQVRLLDVQELLSDSGIGREMHVIVGQGQLDAVLQARPEDRRGFIEEAAGVLKHRKRKEKALRKLEAMQANLTRVTDLTNELRRQLKPLGKQAEIARRAAGVQAELRDSRLRLLADDLVTLRAELDKDVADEEAIRRHRTQVEQALEQARAREAELEQAVAADAPLVARTQETWYRLSALEERFRGTASLAGERARHLAAEPEQARTGREPEQMEAEAAEVRVEEERLQAGLNDAKAALAEAVAERQDFERRLAEAERALVAAARAVADRREGLAKLIGQVNALRTRAAAAADEITRLTAAANDARERGAAADAELNRVQAEVGVLDEGELSLDERHEAAVSAYESAAARMRELAAGEREAERERATWTARADALALGLTRKDGAGALLAAGDRLPGVRGSLAALLTVEPGYEAAIAAALGEAADAIAVDSLDAGLASLAHLKSEDAGRAAMVLASVVPKTLQPDVDLPSGARWALSLVQAPEELRGVLALLLANVLVVDDLELGSRTVGHGAFGRVVTLDGDVLGTGWVAGGSASTPSAIEIQAAVDEAQQKADEAAARHERLHAQLTEATARASELEADVEAALDALHQSDARLSAVAEQLAELGQKARSANAEADRLETARHAAEQARDRDLAGLSELEERLHLAETRSDEPAEPDTAERDSVQGELAAARQAELEARLAVRTGEERARAVAGRADQLMRAAEIERAARRRQQEAREARARAAVVAAAVRDVATQVLGHIGRSVAAAVTERDAAQQARVVREGELLTLRARSRELAAELGQLTDAVHRDEMVRAEQRLRIEQLETRAVEEYGVAVEALVAEYGPDQPCPPSAIETAEYEQAKERGEQVSAPQPGPFHRPTQEKRASRAERDLALLGKVNPLALEEFAALEERHQFLSTQLEDLKATRRDLLTVVKEVDERILEVFTSAYHDVAREFEIVFEALFPGGEGRLVLTDPDEMLLTGIDVEARPPGKKVKRLSLLSGGERSLVAVALLVAIFRARPSPFYVMDEIEAALDDTNLGRLLQLVSDLRSSSQIIIITHQKRTMEIADALYGVTMRGDGVTQVISQRLREVQEPASA